MNVVPEMSNADFLQKFARPGRLGLVGGTTLIDKAIRRAERRVANEGRWSNWSHAFVFGEQRTDGHVWVIESDLQAARKHIRFGVQENRISKYFDGELYGSLAVLDFNLPEEKISGLISAGLDLVANATRYSIRELFGTLLALRREHLRQRENLLAREQSLYCSALVHHLFCRIGIDLTPGVSSKVTTPEDLYRTGVPHTTWLLDRNLEESKLRALAKKVRSKIHRRRNE